MVGEQLSTSEMKGRRTMEKIEKTEKKAYSRPAIVRVKLNPEQAVLSACSTGTVSISSANTGGGCQSDKSCRQSQKAMTGDGLASS
jgi:hypothetical protein